MTKRTHEKIEAAFSTSYLDAKAPHFTESKFIRNVFIIMTSRTIALIEKVLCNGKRLARV